VEALALPTSPPAMGRLGGGQRVRRLHTQDPENSETWRVTFRVTGSSTRLRFAKAAQASALIQQDSETLLLPEERVARLEGKTTGSAGRFTPTWPAAERFEALLRAFNDPAPYVKRLARLIQRNARAIRSYFLHIPERTHGQTVLEEP